MNDVLVLTINYNSSSLVQKLLNSITEPRLMITILILDNASSQEDWQRLVQTASLDSRIHLIRSQRNLGFTAGVNYALKHAQSARIINDFFFLVNPDAISSPNAIFQLFKVINKDKRIACISPKILDLSKKVWYSGGLINFKKGNTENWDGVETGASEYDVDVFSGCAVMFNFKIFSEVGMFNPDLFMYYDEADLSMRIVKHGYFIKYSPNVSILHDVSSTTKNYSHLKTYYMSRNKLLVFKEMGFASKLYFTIFQLFYHLKNKRLKNAWYHLIGVKDYLIGKVGMLEQY